MLRRLLPLLVFVALGLLLFAGIELSRHEDPGALPSALIGKHVPAFTLPQLLAPDKSVRDSDLAGTPYILNVWGSWCVNCREEHPVVTALAERKMVKVIGYDSHDDPDDAKRWLAQFGNPYAMVIADGDGHVALDWGIYGAPETFYVDAGGIVRWKHVGPLTDEIVQKELLPLLTKKGSPQ